MTYIVNRKRQFGVDGTAAVHEFQVIHGTNMCAACDNITFFAFHTFLVEVLPNEAKIELGPNNITAAHAFVIVLLRLGLRASLGRPQKVILTLFED